MMIFILSTMIILLMMLISTLMLKKNNREKKTPFECGFDQKSNNRLPFSMQFFMVSILFTIFDIEILLIMPYPLLMKIWTNSIMFFIIIMTMIFMGTIHEWNQKSFSWLM